MPGDSRLEFRSDSGTQYNPNLLSGWGVRPYNYEFTASVQRELVPRVSVDVGLLRRIFGNFQVTDNLNLDPSNFDSFSMVMPAAGAGSCVGMPGRSRPAA
jgi:hypothetical protein